jgi:hypothetical protein
MLKVVGGRQEMIAAALNGNQLKFAIEIAKPWYLGYVGTPSNFVLRDNAAFATYLQAQSWQKILDQVPRPTYPDGGAGWWVAAPAGIDAPAMPGEITDWTFHPGRAAAILAPDPAWKTYASAKHQSIEDARHGVSIWPSRMTATCASASCSALSAAVASRSRDDTRSR